MLEIRVEARPVAALAMQDTMQYMVSDEKISSSLRKGLAEFCVLAILRGGSTYGLDMARRLERDGLIAGESTLYPLMTRLQSAGLVDSSWMSSPTGRPRKYYTLSQTGNDALEAFERIWPPLRNAVDRTLGEESADEK